MIVHLVAKSVLTIKGIKVQSNLDVQMQKLVGNSVNTNPNPQKTFTFIMW